MLELNQIDAASADATAGYTVPVWLTAAARAALVILLGQPWQRHQPLWLHPDAAAAGELPARVPVLAAAPLADGWVLAMACCDPGPEVLDLTRGLQLWVQLRWLEGPGKWLELRAGEGWGCCRPVVRRACRPMPKSCSSATCGPWCRREGVWSCRW